MYQGYYCDIPILMITFIFEATGIARAVSPAAGGIRNMQYNLGGMNAANVSSSGSSRTLPPPPVSTATTNNEVGELTPVIENCPLFVET
jgi:hypothetical protein